MNTPEEHESHRRGMARFRNSPEVQQAISRLALAKSRRESRYRRRVLLASEIALGALLAGFTLFCAFKITMLLAK